MDIRIKERRESKQLKLEENIIVKAYQPDRKLDTKWLDESKKKIIRSTRIPKKMKRPHQSASQDQATDGATPLAIVEGLSAGAGTGEDRGGTAKQGALPPVREQSLGLCTVQMIRLSEDPPPPKPQKVEQLWRVTPATEAAVRDLMVGEDVTKQHCKDCGFRRMKKRVKIHCMQHFCKYLCESMLIK